MSTDLGARGIDVPDIDNIIHYHLPETEDNYIHRVGRTARWESQGKAFFLLDPTEQIPEYVDAEVEEYEIPADLPAPAKPKMATIYIGKGKKDKISKGDIVGFLCKIGQLQSSEIGKIDVTPILLCGSEPSEAEASIEVDGGAENQGNQDPHRRGEIVSFEEVR